MRAFVASLAAAAALTAVPLATAADTPAGNAASPAPQVKGKPAPRPTKPKRTRTTIPPAKPKKG